MLGAHCSARHSGGARQGRAPGRSEPKNKATSHQPPATSERGSGSGRNAPEPSMLEEISNPNRDRDVASRDSQACLGEARRSEADSRVVRETEALARNPCELVEPAIGILVMKQRDRIESGLQALDPYPAASPRRYGYVPGAPVRGTIRKAPLVGGYAQLDRALGRTQALNIDLQPSARIRASQKRRRRRDRGGLQSPGPKPVISCCTVAQSGPRRNVPSPTVPCSARETQEPGDLPAIHRRGSAMPWPSRWRPRPGCRPLDACPRRQGRDSRNGRRGYVPETRRSASAAARG